jgi:N-acetyl-gamma-glutamyl-phosphate reductase
MSAPERNAVIWGAGGFVGAELLRLVATHPHLDLVGAISNTHAGTPVPQVYPSLDGWVELTFTGTEDWDWSQLNDGSWVVFAALGHLETMKQLPKILTRLEDADVKWVDLSGDFRIEDPTVFHHYYGASHAAPDLLGLFVYGLPELNRSRIVESNRVANPGCFATGAQLAILPAAASGSPIQCIAVDGKTGSSGSGVVAKSTTHHPTRANNFRAYKQLGHQHFPEISAGWLEAGGMTDTEISFVPQSAPMVRGIFTTAHLFLDEPVPESTVRAWYADFYRDAPFVRIVEGTPELTAVWGTNRCDLSIAVSGRKVAVCTAIDNLVKGAAGQAVQNANLMSGWSETAGLNAPMPSVI